MNKQERKEIESIRRRLHEIIPIDDPKYPSIGFHVTSRLWRLSHKKSLFERLVLRIKSRWGRKK